MQKRSKLPLEYLPIQYPRDLAAASYEYALPDRPITKLHRHQSLELGLCLSGSGIFMTGNRVFSFSEGSVCAISAGEEHLAQSAPGTISNWIFMNFEPARLGISSLTGEAEGGWGVPEAGLADVFTAGECQEMGGVIRLLHTELSQQGRARGLAVRGLGVYILAQLSRLPARSGGAARETGITERVAAALNILSRDYMRALSCAELAAACYLSAPHFRRVFRAATGCTPKEYLIRLRLNMAAGLLRSSGRGVYDIALSCGFGAASAFGRHFRAFTGLSPREYRRQARAQ